MIPQEILTRITYAKYILQQGQDLMLSLSPVADGLSVSLFQDSAEMLLRALAEYYEADVGARTSFDEIQNKIEKANRNIKRIQVPSKMAISQLNKSRVNFKHYGLLPTKDDAQKFSRDVDVFFQRILEDFFGLNFEEVSLSTLVKDDRTKNHLKKSESYLMNSEHSMAVEYAARAFCLATRKTEFSKANSKHVIPRDFDNRDLIHAIYEIEQQANNHDQLLCLLQYGINLSDYIYFKKVTPIVHILASNTLHVGNTRKTEVTEQIASFCVNFSITSALKIESRNHILPASSYEPKSDRKFEVTSVGPIIVYPVTDDKIKHLEIIRESVVNEILQGSEKHRDKDEYFSLYLNGERAYIHKDNALEIQ